MYTTIVRMYGWARSRSRAAPVLHHSAQHGVGPCAALHGAPHAWRRPQGQTHHDPSNKLLPGPWIYTSTPELSLVPSARPTEAGHAHMPVALKSRQPPSGALTGL